MDNLGEFEQLVLGAVILLKDNACGSMVRRKIMELTRGGREMSFGGTYTTLIRLENKGYLKSARVVITGRRPARRYHLTPAGTGALCQSLSVVGRLIKELDFQ